MLVCAITNYRHAVWVFEIDFHEIVFYLNEMQIYVCQLCIIKEDSDVLLKKITLASL
jgi:hypothetical protein